ncbi:hypothetical protein U9M48_041999 [Paspalum notatum var. saurae]|uniref:Uncharacterized protein n=1 Tax=Paspalum notatum var. saurae TaxID=547442 RepID=A0AAQ3UQ02_PASNO
MSFASNQSLGTTEQQCCQPMHQYQGKAKMEEKECYFYHKDMKYPTACATKHATNEGYRKAITKDRTT